MSLSIVGEKQVGRLDLPDYLKCPECQLASPQNLVHFGEAARGR